MNCELALSNRKHVREQLTETVRRQNDYAEKYIALVRKTNPVAYRGGMTMLRRHARDVATLPREHRRALEEYRQFAPQHERHLENAHPLTIHPTASCTARSLSLAAGTRAA